MKKTIPLVISFVTICALTGCNEAKQVTGAEIMQLVERSPESMYHAEVVGVINGNAIAKVSKMSLTNQEKWKDSFYYTAITNLPPEWVSSNYPSIIK